MPKTLAKRRKRNNDSYLNLIHQFPLRPIRSDDELNRAIAVIDSLLDLGRLDAGQRDYLDVLSDLVENYEEEHHPIPAPNDAQMLAYLLELKNAKQAQKFFFSSAPEIQNLYFRRSTNRPLHAGY